MQKDILASNKRKHKLKIEKIVYMESRNASKTLEKYILAYLLVVSLCPLLFEEIGVEVTFCVFIGCACTLFTISKAN